MQAVSTDKAPAAIGPYSQAIVTENLIFTSGQMPINPASGKIEATDISGQTEQVLKNLKAVLEAGGSSLSKVIKTTCFLKDIQDFSTFNAVYEKYFSSKDGVPPARSCIEASNLPKGALIEIDAVAEM